MKEERLMLTVVLISLLMLSSACKNPGQNSNERQLLTSSLADKESDNPIGIPGYSLSCIYYQYPTDANPEGAIECAIMAEGEKMPATDWSAGMISEQNSNKNLKTQTMQNGMARIGYRGDNAVETLAVLNSSLHIQAAPSPNKMIKQNGQQLYAADTGAYRLSAMCSAAAGFSIIVYDDRGVFSVKSFPSINDESFTGCSELAESLHWKGFSEKPSSAEQKNQANFDRNALKAECDTNGSLSLQITPKADPAAPIEQVFGKISKTACDSFRQLFE